MGNFKEKTKGVMKKQKVMIILVVLALFFTALYIGVLARPISYGMTYSLTETSADSSTEEVTQITASIKVISGNKAISTYSSDGAGMWAEVWVLINGNKIAIFEATSSMTEEEYNAQVETLKADETTWANYWESDAVTSINAFTMGVNGENMTCNGAIAFAVVMGVVTVISIVMAGFSLGFYIKDKKNAKTIKTDENSEKDIEQGAN